MKIEIKVSDQTDKEIEGQVILTPLTQQQITRLKYLKIICMQREYNHKLQEVNTIFKISKILLLNQEIDDQIIYGFNISISSDALPQYSNQYGCSKLELYCEYEQNKIISQSTHLEIVPIFTNINKEYSYEFTINNINVAAQIQYQNETLLFEIVINNNNKHELKDFICNFQEIIQCSTKCQKVTKFSQNLDVIVQSQSSYIVTGEIKSINLTKIDSFIKLSQQLEIQFEIHRNIFSKHKVFHFLLN